MVWEKAGLQGRQWKAETLPGVGKAGAEAGGIGEACQLNEKSPGRRELSSRVKGNPGVRNTKGSHCGSQALDFHICKMA